MEPESIHVALQNLNQFAGIQGKWNPKGPLDGELKLNVNGHKYTFAVGVKREVRAHQLTQVERRAVVDVL
jgi:hypothetical protein